MVGHIPSIHPTLCNEYPNEEKEFVFWEDVRLGA